MATRHDEATADDVWEKTCDRTLSPESRAVKETWTDHSPDPSHPSLSRSLTPSGPNAEGVSEGRVCVDDIVEVPDPFRLTPTSWDHTGPGGRAGSVHTRGGRSTGRRSSLSRR